MANMNLFEKYGIKEVADVTFYRIEKREETFESQREIAVSSILKGALELMTVYPIGESGISENEGFEAYVFSDASIRKGVNYACDDTTEAIEEEEVTITGPDGTHEYTYEEQILMMFSKNQNLISKTGTRYQFKDTNGIFGDLVFDDQFAAAPQTSAQVVVLGISGKLDPVNYDLEEVQGAIKNLTSTYSAKAYDVTYSDYAELVVEDEMGYFDPAFLGTLKEGEMDFFTVGNTYNTFAETGKGIDFALSTAEMWDSGVHESINDAIDALRQKKLSLDAGAESALKGIDKVSGGYKVTNGKPEAGTSDEDVVGNKYSYSVGDSTSTYALQSVLEALNTIAVVNAADLKNDSEITVTAGTETSNRAIYVRVDGLVDVSAGAYIYLLTNKNAKRLATDKDGIFWFNDKKGNKLYYQDKIFAGTETLALVIIGNKGLIFVVNRHGNKNFDKVAWMVNENGYITNSQAKTIVNNGLIHTVDVTVNNETFDATCTVSGLKVRKIQKKVNRYVPVLFLDTLKVSTLEQTASETAATGGHGNARLIEWDYGKEITLTLEDALYSPASMSAMLGSYNGSDFTTGVKDTKKIDRMEKVTAKRSFIVPAGNAKGVPSEGENSPQAVFIDLSTMKPYQDGAPIAEGELFLKWTRSVAYGENSLGNTIEISADKFPGTYKIVGETFARNKDTGEDQRFQFVVPLAKMKSDQTITLQAEGDSSVFNLSMTVLRPDDGVMVKLIQYDVIDNEEENDGSTMVKGTENLNLLDDAEMFRVDGDEIVDETFIGATEY